MKNWPGACGPGRCARLGIGNEAITEEVFLKHLVDAGRKIGLGRFRPSSRGFYGRFVVTDYKFTE